MITHWCSPPLMTQNHVISQTNQHAESIPPPTSEMTCVNMSNTVSIHFFQPTCFITFNVTVSVHVGNDSNASFERNVSPKVMDFTNQFCCRFIALHFSSSFSICFLFSHSSFKSSIRNFNKRPLTDNNSTQNEMWLMFISIYIKKSHDNMIQSASVTCLNTSNFHHHHPAAVFCNSFCFSFMLQLTNHQYTVSLFKSVNLASHLMCSNKGRWQVYLNKNIFCWIICILFAFSLVDPRHFNLRLNHFSQFPFNIKMIFTSWQFSDWLAKQIIMLGFMDLRWLRDSRRSDVDFVWIGCFITTRMLVKLCRYLTYIFWSMPVVLKRAKIHLFCNDETCIRLISIKIECIPEQLNRCTHVLYTEEYNIGCIHTTIFHQSFLDLFVQTSRSRDIIVAWSLSRQGLTVDTAKMSRKRSVILINFNQYFPPTGWNFANVAKRANLVSSQRVNVFCTFHEIGWKLYEILPVEVCLADRWATGLMDGKTDRYRLFTGLLCASKITYFVHLYGQISTGP